MTIQRIKGVGYLNIHVSAMLLCSFNASPSPKVKLHVCPNRLNICLILAIKWHHFYPTRIRYLSNLFTESALLVVETWMMWPLLIEKKTLPKAQRTRGLSSYHNLWHKSWSNFNFRNFTTLKLKIFTKPSFRILDMIQLRILPKPCAQSRNKS